MLKTAQPAGAAGANARGENMNYNSSKSTGVQSQSSSSTAAGASGSSSSQSTLVAAIVLDGSEPEKVYPELLRWTNVVRAKVSSWATLGTEA